MSLLLPDPKYRAGTIITCWRCRARIAIIQRDLYSEEAIKAEDLKGLQEEIKQFDEMICEICGMPYFKGGKLHTKDGWI